MDQPRLTIIVLNNNRCEDTLACLDSLFQSDYQLFQVITIDNVSTDNSIEAIHEKYPEVKIIPLSENHGYAGSNNIGIQAALEQGAEWVFLLNDDTVLDRSCLSRLIEVGISDPAIGMIGPLVYHFDEPQIIQSAGGMLGKSWQSVHLGQNELDNGQFNSARPVEWISGCAIMVRRAVVEQVGLLDPNYFLYWEDTDWCLRAARAGWKILQVPDAKLWHKGVQRNYQPRPYVTYYTTRNYLFTLAKHKAPWAVRMLALMNILRTLLSWSVKPQWKEKRDHRNAMWKGIIDFLSHRMGSMTS